MKTITLLPGERLLDSKTVARMLKVSTERVVELVEEGAIDAIDLGTQHRHLIPAAAAVRAGEQHRWSLLSKGDRGGQLPAHADGNPQREVAGQKPVLNHTSIAATLRRACGSQQSITAA